MEKAEENREKWSYFSRKRNLEQFEENEGGEVDIELSLGLNGKFGVDPKRAKTLKRSSSSSITTNFLLCGDDRNELQSYVATCPPLCRTCSLPVETEEEWRKRKELESLRRFEAKKKRMEKLKNFRGGSENEESGGVVCGNFFPSSCGGSSQGSGSSEFESKPIQGGSLGSSQGSGSSGISEFKSTQHIQGPSGRTETRLPANSHSPKHEQTEARPPPNSHSPKHERKPPQAVPETPVHERKLVATTSQTGNEISLSRVSPNTVDKEAKEMLVRKFMLNMPCVSTKGDGPNGKKIEGFLYGYSKGEEVKIVCVCHGIFLTPAEFVKHGGGGDVTHPLKHIVVNPSPLL